MHSALNGKEESRRRMSSRLVTDFLCNLQVYRIDRSNKIPRSIPRVSSSGKRGILLKLSLEQRMIPDYMLGVWSGEDRNKQKIV